MDVVMQPCIWCKLHHNFDGMHTDSDKHTNSDKLTGVQLNNCTVHKCTISNKKVLPWRLYGQPRPKWLVHFHS